MKNHIRLFAFVLALIMALTFSGCSPSGIQQAGSLPSTGSTPATSPSSITYEEAHIAELITKLEKAHTDAGTNYEEAMAVLSEDFDNKLGEENEAAFTAIKNGMDSALAERQNAISGLISLLQTCDPNQVAQNADKIAEAESMLANKEHRFGDAICHSRNAEGTLCTDMDYYQICSECNLLQWSKGGHSWYYNRTESDHQNCCRNCSATETAAAHNLTDGKCDTCSYVVNANILVIEGTKGESAKLCDTIGSKHTVTVVTAADSATLPASVEALQAYHEVILCNVANADLPAGFAELLQSYVRDFGGSLFTVGGDKAYQPEDMGGTTYEDMLPVEITVPSMAVVILIDVSGSMLHDSSGNPYAESKLAAAKQGAKACLDVLTENDYVCIMPITDMYDGDYEMIPQSQRDKIVQAIEDLYALGAGTIFSVCLQKAGTILNEMTNVDKRHIILITDGEPATPDFEAYTYAMKQNAAQGITTSIVGIQCTSYAVANMTYVLKECAGMSEKNFYDVQDLSQVSSAMRQDLTSSEIRGINCQRYMPSIVTDNSITEDLTVENMPVLDGAYYSKLKEGATEVLGSPYGPLYAQWQYGKGMVGSFMCDLNGTWSAEFLASETGAAMIHGMISHLVNEKTSEEEVPSPAPTVGNQVGDLCPSTQLCILTGDGISSQTIDPSALGKITIINFWGVWCGPCKAELPYFDQVASMFADQVTVVAVHSLISVSDGPEYIAEKYPNSKIIFAVDNQCDETDIVGIRGELFLALGFRDLYPATVILDENGVILYSSTKSFLTLEELLAVLPESLFDDTVS